MNGPLSIRAGSVLAAIFFASAIGLGLAALGRYDPQTVKGLNDTRSYVAMVDGLHPEQPTHALRVLVPMLARPLASIARGHVGSWSPELFGLLIINSGFVAFSALLLASIAARLSLDRLCGLVAGLLYLLTFNVSSLYLAGLVDSVEGWAIIAVIWSLIMMEWHLVPAAGFIGALGKETSVPLIIALCGVWLMRSRRSTRPGLAATAFLSLVAAQAIAVILASWIAGGRLALPWNHLLLVRETFSSSNARVGTLLNREWIYAFVWLAPLGLMRIRRLPSEWLSSSIVTFAVAIILATMAGSRGNVVRPAFNAIAPALVVSAAIYLNDLLRRTETAISSA